MNHEEVTDLNKSIEKSLIVKSNKIIEARYKLKSMEIKLIMILISLIDKEDKDFKEYTIKVQDLSDILNLKTKNIYEKVRSITKSLRERTLEIEDHEKLIQVGWLSSAVYLKKEGKVKLRFDPDLKPYLLQLKDNFTKYQLKYILNLSCEYSPRFYSLLKQYEPIGSRSFDYHELREILKIEDHQYKLYGDFKRYVLKVSQREIDKFTDIKFDFKEIKKGKKVVGLDFSIYSKRKLIEVSNDFSGKVIEALKSLGLNKKDIDTILVNHKIEVVQQTLDNYNALPIEKLNRIKNPAGYFLEMLPEPGEDCQPSKAFMREKEAEKKLERENKENERKRLLDGINKEFNDLKDHKREMAIKKLSDNEIKTLKDEFLKNTTDFIRGQAKEKSGFERLSVKSAFNKFLNEKFLNPYELDFIKFARKKGYKVKLNVYGKYELI
ncbi:MAG: initiator RepB protein [Candidatus Magnetoglobus multicellularis str. Araruama]|uniref:Initiator RepB protein n=1 Tax=Candidatus Magnetoglobus multicellularis str. Araruama TaxID=890399 RepID=A0A1V1NVF8_9BACT|nr:MAG: initiator RepB protein [Candidatus Magnetoglobus multicellularis str. Araruama]